MENIQINGQKIWGPPRDWTGPPPPHGTEIYIKNLPDDVYEIELFQIFSVVGRVYEVRLPVHWSGVNRGYAFVRYTKIADADTAIRAFDGFEIRTGRTVKIERSVDNTRLFLSCVPCHKTSEDIKRDLQTVVDNVEKVYVYPTLENPAVFRGYAFVEFKSHRDAAIAKRILTPDICFNLFGKKCVAAWANPLPFLNENILKTINILFMRNVPKEVKSSAIKRAIENVLDENSVQKVKRLNDFAFLTFKTHEDAKAALNIIKNHPILLGDNQIQVEWAVPRELNNINDCNIEEYDNKRLNHSLFKQNKNSTKAMKNAAKIEKDSHDDNLNLFGPQKRSENVDQFVTRSQNKFRKILKDSRDRLKGLKGNSFNFPPSKMESTTPSFKMDKIGICGNECDSAANSDLWTTTGISNGFQNLLDLGPVDGVWNLSPSSDLESEESFKSPQLKPWLGNFVYSSSSSPSLTASSADSPDHWGNDEITDRITLGSQSNHPSIGSLKITDDNTGSVFSQFGKFI
ncbi:hypothetical protein RUM44_006305 [Polyplax serrata]|uniref:RRM domain-containing protein n=1 Tax=Polyplax serrata TaxID=468196 RepID=A0ABR1AHT2_POLSC